MLRHAVAPSGLTGSGHGPERSGPDKHAIPKKFLATFGEGARFLLREVE
jgi:hypothetical protein